MKDRLLQYLKSQRHLWWTITVIPGVYSILYLYTNNFTLVNSWHQVMMCVLAFVLLPVIEILILDAAFKKWLPAHRDKLYWSYLIINFSILLSLTIYLGWRWKALILIAVIAIALSFFIAQHYKKLVLLIAFMTVVAFYQFGHFYIERVVSREDWVTTQEFESYKFTKKPNVYLIQPDGFIGKQAATGPIYDLDLSAFYNELEQRGFNINHDYHSSYHSTLTSNSALFTGQHHYFEQGNMNNELYGAREIIVEENPVLKTFKSNGYQTNLILQHSYLLLNFPDTAYDYINVDEDELSAPIPDYFLDKDYAADFKDAVNNANALPQFYFVEILQPGHITTTPNGSEPQEQTDIYKSQLLNVVPVIIDMIDFIKQKDPNSIIIIAADHGGFAGLNSTGDAYAEPTDNVAIKQSIFSALFAVNAPTDFQSYQSSIKSSVAVFPNLISYLADKKIAKDSLDQSSYIFINKGADRGIFKYFDSNGNPVTQKVD
ncbi:alkaline phosphatase family protein [Nonlabens ponticola]|uniref:Sulfatase N-terminal domain-containing protein n=1 Tax=Nonlabens ponticola TaxID=2496866 RepID=A0A3S9MUA6_9FLAO|nr:hypothetical protein [Nonlabens ponticola]AZQ42743.1 hypothetical protein EJ995_00245 [Nonlabens ponticola]